MRTKLQGVKLIDKGLYEVRVYWTDAKTGRYRETLRRVKAKSAKEAAEVRVQIAQELAESSGTKKRIRLTDYATSWLVWKRKTLRKTTLARYVDALDGHILPLLGEYYVDLLEQADIVAWLGQQSGKAETINGRLRILKTMLADAAVELSLAQNPAARVKAIPAEHETNIKRDGYKLSQEELTKVLDAALKHAPKWFPLIYLLAFTGLRFGEATALHWADVDWLRKQIRIERSQTRRIVGPPKTKSSRRMVPLSDEMAEVLKQHRATLIDRGYEGELVFPGDTGDYLYSSALQKPMRRILAHAGINRPIPRAHGFRHTYNNLVRQIAGEVAARAIVGHSTLTASERYSAVGPDERHEIAEAIRVKIRVSSKKEKGPAEAKP